MSRTIQASWTLKNTFEAVSVKPSGVKVLSICWICLMPRLRSSSTTDASGIMRVLACDVDDQDGMALSWGVPYKARQNLLYTSAEINRPYSARYSSTPCARVQTAIIARL